MGEVALSGGLLVVSDDVELITETGRRVQEEDVLIALDGTDVNADISAEVLYDQVFLIVNGRPLR